MNIDLKWIYQATVLLITALLFGCAPMPVKIITDKSFDFKASKTYFVVPNTQDDLINLPLEKAVIDTIVTETIDSQLGDKGYQKLSDKPDLLLSYYLVTNAKTDVFVVNKYYGDLGYQLPPGRSSTRDSLRFQEVTYEEGILIIDVIDAVTNNRVWQGYLTSRTDIYKSEKRKELRLRNAVTKILDRLPSPASK